MIPFIASSNSADLNLYVGSNGIELAANGANVHVE
jgi:hypothetical protein